MSPRELVAPPVVCIEKKEPPCEKLATGLLGFTWDAVDVSKRDTEDGESHSRTTGL